MAGLFVKSRSRANIRSGAFCEGWCDRRCCIGFDSCKVMQTGGDDRSTMRSQGTGGAVYALCAVVFGSSPEASEGDVNYTGEVVGTLPLNQDGTLVGALCKATFAWSLSV